MQEDANRESRLPGLVLIGVLALGLSGIVWGATGRSDLNPSGFTPTASVRTENRETSTETEHKPDPNVLEIGMSAPFSGPSRGLGIELYRGSAAYFEQINRKGGIHGHRIQIRAYDDSYNPEPAIENTFRLIEKDRVFALFNYVGTPTTTRCLPFLKLMRHRSTYLFFPFTGAQPQRQAPYGEFTFNFRASYYQETAGLVDHFVEIGCKRIAVFYQADAYGRNGWDGVREALARHGLKVAGEATYQRGTAFSESMNSQVDILRECQPDAVISIGAYAAVGAFIRDARNAGLEVPIANVSFVGSQNLVDLLRKTESETGKVYTEGLINSQVVPSFNDTSLQAVREYREAMDQIRPSPPAHLLKEPYEPNGYGFVSLEGFLNAKLLGAILEKMGTPLDRTRVRQAAESIKNLDLGIGLPVSFSETRHQAVDRVYFTIVRRGQFEPLTDWRGIRK